MWKITLPIIAPWGAGGGGAVINAQPPDTILGMQKSCYN